MKFAGPFLELPQVPWFGGDMYVVGVVVAVDRIVADQGLRQVQSLDRQVEQAERVLAADCGGQGLLTRRKPKDGLAAAAARCSVTHHMRLEQGNPVAALR